MSDWQGADDGPRVSTLSLGPDELVVITVPIKLGPAIDGLTSAEVDVCRGVLAGLSDLEIAEQRGTSPSTVANQLAAIYAKLAVHSRTELVVLLEARGEGS